MKIKSIDSYMSKDGQTRWRVHFEGDDKPLIMGSQPSYKEGDEIPQEKLKLVSKGDRQYYLILTPQEKPKPARVKEPTPRKYGKSPEELEQSARTMALSYSKDLAVAGKIPVEDILSQADRFLEWIKK
jgi:hypothetical protein